MPLIKFIGYRLDVYALENERTVHHGKIVRIGGVAIYLAFIISMGYFFMADKTINSILLGGMLVFFTGLIDDMIDLPAKVKFLMQCAAALIAIYYGGIYIEILNLPFNITLDTGWLSFLVTFFWIVGVTNAINLIDGLDGLSSGISIIVLVTISFIAFMMNRYDVCFIALILAGSSFGFWFYNFHPASIFMGDCGALFLGYNIACLSLLGFKTTTVITLGFPIIILFVPISDTLMAIIRRKLRGEKIDVADRGHLHHVLMFKLNLGHRNAVLALYATTLVFSICAIISYFDKTLGLILLLILSLFFELFIEYTGMINPKYHPIIGLSRRLFGWPAKKNNSADE
ncbi:MAG: MraY family glycosyltransferase [Erysipelotrichaceae bacterium]|nr:MraY family glycosyltransferase [Erysipelotrichaceae bacterium]